jgi:hypothetical protein
LYKKYPCPLSSGLLYTASNVNVYAMGYNNSTTVELRWFFKSAPSNSSFKNVRIDKYCNDTVKTTVDIN